MFDLPYPALPADLAFFFDSLGIVFSLLIGATIGSFLNVVVYRIPNNLKVNNPKRSFCPKCHYNIPWYHNLPAISWLVLRGKCANCHEPISIRYWLVEIFTAILFCSIWLCFPPIPAILIMGWFAFAISTSLIDYDHMLVFPSQTWPAVGIALFLPWVAPEMFFTKSIGDAYLQSMIGIVGGYVLIRIIIELGKLAFGKWKREFATPVSWELREAKSDEDELTFILNSEELLWGDLFSRKTDKIIVSGGSISIDGQEAKNSEFAIQFDKIIIGEETFDIEKIKSASGTAKNVTIPREAMGRGDADIMAMIGAIGGWPILIFALFAASIIGVLSGIIGRLSPSARMPFGPCLLGGAAIWIFGGYKLWLCYINFSY